MLFLHSLRLWNLWDVFFFILTCKHANSRSHKFKALLEKSRQLFFLFFQLPRAVFPFWLRDFSTCVVPFAYGRGKAYRTGNGADSLGMQWLLAPGSGNCSIFSRMFLKTLFNFLGWHVVIFSLLLCLTFCCTSAWSMCLPTRRIFQLVFQLGCLGCCSLACQLVG